MNIPPNVFLECMYASTIHFLWLVIFAHKSGRRAQDTFPHDHVFAVDVLSDPYLSVALLLTGYTRLRPRVSPLGNPA